MLPRVEDPTISTETCAVPIDRDALMFVKILRGPRRSGRTAIYIHGGGSGGNHTIVERPSRHLIHSGFFDTILLPDRLGDGASSPLKAKHTIMDHARDMAALLDQLEIHGPLTALGVSYGGPIALGLAQIDRRVERVALVASSPCLSENNGLTHLLVQSGLLRRIMRISYRANLGKLPPGQVDFDPAYDAKSPVVLVRLFTECLRRTPREHLDSMIFGLEATFDAASASLPEDTRLDIPVIQVIGEGDEVWGGGSTQRSQRHALPAYRERFPGFRQFIVPGAKIHKDVLLKPGLFQQKLAQALSEEFHM